jgi:cystathionine beta-lyase/cystathionine gamma-synthase
MDDIKISGKRIPIYRDSSFRFKSIAQAEKAFKNEDANPQSSSDFIYTRYGNPNVVETETEIAELEGSAWALLSPSGMSAIDVALSIYQKKDESAKWLFFSELYGGTNAYIDHVLIQRRGIHVERYKPIEREERFDIASLSELLDILQPELIFFEPMSNPLLIVVDGNQIIKMAKERSITVIVDNTFVTPHLWRPLENGADISIQSATKYLSGHGNITAGVVSGNDPELRKQIMIYRKIVGQIFNPDDAYRLSTQLKTFDLRFRKQCENAHRLAHTLERHKEVERVRYPSLESHVTNEEAKRLFSGNDFGALITFELKGGRKACDLFVEKISGSVSYTPTLGDAESTLIHVPTVFGEERYPFPGMIRLSVGFEPYEEIEKSVIHALDGIVYP